MTHLEREDQRVKRNPVGIARNEDIAVKGLVKLFEHSFAVLEYFSYLCHRMASTIPQHFGKIKKRYAYLDTCC